ncbi:unnamed protein product [Bursaphelenchus xylophilus]|uniref:Probable pectate lyase F n=1 Tax=Bursaphelenchus xylophilus TaxID=6326 RepID=A0A1I7RTD2_BURXY|nr:unnamed protein product [Bursaphelenchus xylophilus]CAG9122496.1 unnamed protein product [Bursaphelenchus xylophilus]
MVHFSVPLLCLVTVASGSFPSWPSPTSTTTLAKTVSVKADTPYDGKLVRFNAAFGDGGQDEGQAPLFELEDGATIKNVVIGPKAADGIHCKGSCTIENCWWEDVGEDAATFRGTTSAKYTVSGGGAQKADDKVFQHNGFGTVTITNFQATDIGKLYRSCGNCVENGKDRHVVIDTVKLSGTTKVIAGVNGNYGDTAILKNIQIAGTVKVVCENYKGISDNDEEPKGVASYTTTQDGDGKICIYKKSDIVSA